MHALSRWWEMAPSTRGVLHRVEVDKGGAALDVEGEMCLEVVAEGDLYMGWARCMRLVDGGR